MEIKEISLDELKVTSSREGFNISIIEKDYLITYLLYMLRDIEGIYFKGGTAINKLFLDNKRLSEDIDFSLTRNTKEVTRDIEKAIEGTIFRKIEKGKSVEGFTRLIVYYRLFHDEGKIFIDLNEKAKILLKPEKYKINHFYQENIPQFSFNCLNKKEMIAEKIRAVIERYKPRDYIDLFNIIKANLPIGLELVKEKFKLSNKSFSIFLIFKNTNKVFRIWEKDLAVLTKEQIEFKEVITTLAKYFNLKKEKEKLKKQTT